MLNISFLRIFALALAFVCVAISWWGLRAGNNSRLYKLLLIPALGALICALFPDLLNLPASVLLPQAKNARIILLVIISNVYLIFFTLYMNTKMNNRYLMLDKLLSGLLLKEFKNKYKNLSLDGCVVVLIPAYNESECIGSVLSGLPTQVLGLPLKSLVIDDGSHDATADIASSHGALTISSPMNRGGGAALRAGFEILNEFDIKAVVTMDADGQHCPEDIETVVKPLLDGDGDLVIGSRMLGSSDKYSTIRLLGVKVFGFLLNILAGTKITDPSSGFRSISQQIIRNCVFCQDQYHTAEMIIVSYRNNYTIVEVPVHINSRLAGTSKKGGNFLYAFSFFKTIIRTWLR